MGDTSRIGLLDPQHTNYQRNKALLVASVATVVAGVALGLISHGITVVIAFGSTAVSWAVVGVVRAARDGEGDTTSVTTVDANDDKEAGQVEEWLGDFPLEAKAKDPHNMTSTESRWFVFSTLQDQAFRTALKSSLEELVEDVYTTWTELIECNEGEGRQNAIDVANAMILGYYQGLRQQDKNLNELTEAERKDFLVHWNNHVANHA